MKTLNTYMDNAWEDLEADNDWWKAVLALGLMNCVPLIGQIAMFGYLFDWAKEVAWGMKTPLSRKLNDIGRCFKYGFMALWVIIIWVVPVVVAGLLLGLIPVAGPIICFIVEVFAVLVAALSAVGAFRSIIYERIMPGLQFKRVFRMFRRDAGGLWQVFCIILLDIPLLVAALFIVLLPTIPFINAIMAVATIRVLGADLVPLVLFGMLTIVVALVVWVMGALASAFIATLYIRALGYWMERFKPAEWRTPSTPMPFEREMEAEREEKREAKEAAKQAARDKKKADKQRKRGAEQSEATEDAAPSAGAFEQSDAGDRPGLEAQTEEENAE